MVFGQFDDEVIVVMRDIAVPVSIIKLEVDRKVVLRLLHHSLAFFQKTVNFQIKDKEFL